MFTFEANLLCDTPDCCAVCTGEVGEDCGHAMLNAEREAKVIAACAVTIADEILEYAHKHPFVYDHGPQQADHLP